MKSMLSTQEGASARSAELVNYSKLLKRAAFSKALGRHRGRVWEAIAQFSGPPFLCILIEFCNH